MTVLEGANLLNRVRFDYDRMDLQSKCDIGGCMSIEDCISVLEDIKESIVFMKQILQKYYRD